MWDCGDRLGVGAGAMAPLEDGLGQTDAPFPLLGETALVLL